MATIFPAASTFTFGTTVQTGMAVESFDQNDNCKVYEQMSNVGEVINIVTYDLRSECTLKGEFTSALGAILGKELTVANLINVQVPSGGISICKGVNTSFNRARNASVSISTTYYPLVTA